MANFNVFGKASNVFKHIAWGQVRAVAISVGSVLATIGVVDADTATNTVNVVGNNLEVIAGAALAIVGAVGSVVNKLRVERKIETVASASAAAARPVDAKLN